MNIEQTIAIEERAARHAALGDATRLRIIDMLALGDITPGEIRSALGLPSNLLAHHLKTLEEVGLVVRSRSEADRRRSYVHLSDASEASAGGSLRADRVVFVCTANSARSQLAAALWSRYSSVPATSGGTRPAARIDPGAIAAAERHRLRIANDAPRALDAVLTDTDLVVTVCDNAREVFGLTGGIHWSVPDPVRVGTVAAFDTTYAELQRRVSDLAPRLAAS